MIVARRSRPGAREFARFAATLAAIVGIFFHEALFGGKVLSPADVLFASASFRSVKGPDYVPLNRLLMDPVLQFQPWLEFNRAELRAGRLPLWNPYAGCGAPHLANGQSAVFDPFHLIAYLGRLPDALGWMAAARLWVAGVGIYLLARRWGLGPWGRWFAGLVYPFSGFLVVWLLYPVTSVAVWFPWVMLATDLAIERPTPRRVGTLAFCVAASILGGHVQTTAHLLLAAGLYALYRCRSAGVRGLAGWAIGVGLGIGIAAVEWLPLAEYLTKSPVWSDRAAERTPAWTFARPRVLDAACTALPYTFGSQRRGHPNLARAVGVHNLNESAGGFAGLATLIWLAPLAWSSRKDPRVGYLLGLVGFGLLAAFRWPPADNLLRAIPVLNVTDNRRLTLWVAFGLSLLGGVGLDRLGASRRGRGWTRWAIAWLLLAAGSGAVAVGIGRFEPRIRAITRAHYAAASRETPGAEPGDDVRRADRQVRDTLGFVPLYYGLASIHLVALAGALWLVRGRRLGSRTWARPALLGLTLLDLLGFGIGLNPAIDRGDDRPITPLIRHLREVAATPAKMLGVGEEFPPNLAMRYGLSDVRNYDSVELAASVENFRDLYPPGRGERTSRRAVTWAGVVRARERLVEAGVRAIVAATPPPDGAFDAVDRIGPIYVARLGPAGGGPFLVERAAPRRFDWSRIGGPFDDPSKKNKHLRVNETQDGNWFLAGSAAGPCEAAATLDFPVAGDARGGRVEYAPRSFRVACAIGLASLIAAFLGCGTRFRLD